MRAPSSTPSAARSFSGRWSRPSRRARSLDVRWAVVQYPTEAAAAEAGMALPRVRGLRLRRLPARLGRRGAADAADQGALRRGRGGPHRRRRDRPHAQRSQAAAGSSPPVLATCPTARSSTAPSRTRAEGVIAYSEFPAVYLGHDVEGARLVFREGRVVEVERDGRRGLPAAGAAHGRRRQPAGRARHRLQPAHHAFTRNVLFDEKIDGTVHLARRRQLHLRRRQERERRALGHGQGPPPRRRALRRRRARPARRRWLI